MKLVFKEVTLGGIAPRLARILLPLYVVAASAYLYWRLHNVAEWNAWYAPVLFVAEIYSVLFTIVYLMVSRKIMQPVWWPPIPDATVDVFITTYNEPDDIVKMTTIGALNVKGVRHVFVLDDGNRQSIRQLAKSLGAKYEPRTTNLHAKAGNMNNGIKASDAEFMIFLDCDHVPSPNFIERTLGYFRDPKLAFVQTPQTFYNPSSIQFRKTPGRHFWNEQSMFYESIQPAKNAFNAAFFCGSSSILRRSAIDSVGGFATGTATEDIHTSLRLHARGWSSLFLSEPLAYGLAAEDIGEYHKQRVRWGAGSLGLLFRSPDSPLRTRGLTLMQRLCYLHSTITFINGLQRLFYIVLPAMLLIFLPLIQLNPGVPVLKFTYIATPFVVFSYFITYLSSRRTFRPIYMEQFNIIYIFSNFLSSKGIINIQKKFKVSVKRKVVTKETSSQRVLLIYLGLTILAMAMGLIYWFMYWQRDAESLLTSTAFSALIWNATNLFFVATIAWYVNFHNQRKANKHTVDARIINQEVVADDYKLKLERISLEGAEVLSPVNMSGKIKLELTSKLTLKAKVISIKTKQGYLLDIEFNQLTLKGDKLLTLFMFHDLVPRIIAADEIKKRKLQLSIMRRRQPALEYTKLEPESV